MSESHRTTSAFSWAHGPQVRRALRDLQVALANEPVIELRLDAVFVATRIDRLPYGVAADLSLDEVGPVWEFTEDQQGSVGQFIDALAYREPSNPETTDETTDEATRGGGSDWDASTGVEGFFEDRAKRYLRTALELLLPEHQHVSVPGPRRRVTGEVLTCPMCQFVDETMATVHGVDDMPDEVVRFAHTYAEAETDEHLAHLVRVAHPWVMEQIAQPWTERAQSGPSARDLGLTVRRVMAAAGTRSRTGADAVARLWDGWTVHRSAGGSRRATTCVLSRGERVAVVRLCSWDFDTYTTSGVEPVQWSAKTTQERVAALLECVETSLVAESVDDLLDQVESVQIRSKGTGYTQRAKDLMVSEIQAAFPEQVTPYPYAG